MEYFIHCTPWAYKAEHYKRPRCLLQPGWMSRTISQISMPILVLQNVELEDTFFWIHSEMYPGNKLAVLLLLKPNSRSWELWCKEHSFRTLSWVFKKYQTACRCQKRKCVKCPKINCYYHWQAVIQITSCIGWWAVLEIFVGFGRPFKRSLWQ